MTALAARRAPGRALAWWLALRPWSFSISLAPVLAGTSLAVLDGYPADFAIACVALVACVMIHAGTNLQNDVGDFRRGADLTGRVGKNTLAVRLGRRFTVWEYAGLLHAPFALVLLLAHAEHKVLLAAPLVLLPWATTLAQRVRRAPAGTGLNAVLAATANLGLAYALLLTPGALVQI